MTARLLLFRAHVSNLRPDAFLLHRGCVAKGWGRKESGDSAGHDVQRGQGAGEPGSTREALLWQRGASPRQ